MKTSMSLHRVISQIKSIEERLHSIRHTPFAQAVKGGNVELIGELRKGYQSAQDRFASDIQNLATLKAARNLANSTTSVSIAGRSMTIDQALATKSTIQYRQELVNTLKSQLVSAESAERQAKEEQERKLGELVSKMFTGTRKATTEELDVLRNQFEKVQVVHSTNLKELIASSEKEIQDFTTEIDFALSEANAVNKVDVELV